MKNHSKRLLIGAFSLALFSVAALANTTGSHSAWSSYQHKDEGWWWYKDPPPEPELEPELPPEPEPTVKVEKAQKEEAKEEKGPDVFSAMWLKENMPKMLFEAIDNPTKENIERYEYAKRIMLDKSQTYAERTRDVVINDPFLDENNRVPLATFAKTALFNSQTKELDKALKYLSEKVGIWMFFDSTCEYCYTQVGSIQKLEQEYGFNTMYISVDGEGMPMLKEWYVDEGQAKSLGLTITPTTVVVVPPNQIFIISQGAMAYDQLQERILLSANSNNLLPPEFQKGLHVFNKGLLTEEELSVVDGEVDWLSALKNRLEARHE